MFRLIISIFIGFILGRERKKRLKSNGGSRTMALMSAASCLLAILSLELIKSGYTFDFVRMFSYSLAGVGFLCSAVINKKNKSVEGLTTATLIWISLPISFCIGLGYYWYGLITALFVYLILESKYFNFKKLRRYKNGSSNKN